MACREVSTWITENVLTPVERFITSAAEVCEMIPTWVEENIQQPVESWISQTERRCREQACNWWCLCCNKWFCWLVTVLVRVVTWVLVTVGKWVSYLVCKIVVTVLGSVIEFVLKVITRLVTFFVCLFTDPLKALSVLWDLWNDIVDLVEDLLDLVVSLLDDVKEILTDVTELLGGLGRSFCIFGKEACAVFTAIFGALIGLVDWAADVVDWVRDTIEGVRDLVIGLLSLNWCGIQKGLGILSVFRAVTSVTRLLPAVFYEGPKDLITQANLEGIITNALGNAFGVGSVRFERARTLARLGGFPIGVPCQIDPRRIAIRSSEFLRGLHREGILDLYAVAGRFTNCQGKFVKDQFEGDVVYTGTSTKVTKTDLDDFIALGPAAVPSFTVYPIKPATFKKMLETAHRLAFQVGINFTWLPVREIVVSERRFIPLQDSETLGDSNGKLLFGMMGRGAGEDLSVFPLVSVFGYTDVNLHGLSSPFTSAASSPTGTTFRTRFPEKFFLYVPIHELGHSLSLPHAGHTHAGEIMWKPNLPVQDWVRGVMEYLFLSGEANFTEQDARDTWNWITNTPEARDSIIP